MANKAYAMSLRRARANGVDSGLYAMELVSLIAADNILKDYIEDDKMPTVLRELEKEMQRIWAETTANAKRKGQEAMDAADLLVGHCERIRAERGMDK